MGIRDFRNTTQVTREVRETGAEVVITVDGEPVAVIGPYTKEDGESEDLCHDLAVLGRLEKLSEELAKSWSPGLSAADAVSEQRKPAQERLVEWPLPIPAVLDRLRACSHNVATEAQP